MGRVSTTSLLAFRNRPPSYDQTPAPKTALAVAEAPKTPTTTPTSTPHPPYLDIFLRRDASTVPSAPADVPMGTGGAVSPTLPHNATADLESASD